MHPDEFDALVERALKKIPKRFRDRLENVAIVVEQEPPRPNLLGLYQGRPLTHRGVSDSFAMPDRITVYQGPHERMSRTREQLQMLIDETVWHEIAHYFGLDEREVRQAERRRRLESTGRGTKSKERRTGAALRGNRNESPSTD
jgi:predicted Zn-dependent protease with MMP-like domain